MTSRSALESRLEFRRTALDEARRAYIGLLSGQVQSYAIGGRNLTRLDLDKLSAAITNLEKEVDELEEALRGGKRRKAVAAVIRDW